MFDFIKKLFGKKEEKKDKIVRKSAAVTVAPEKKEQKEVSTFEIKEESGNLFIFYNGVLILSHKPTNPYVRISLAKVFASTVNGNVKTRIETAKQILLREYNIICNDKTAEIEFFQAGYNVIVTLSKSENGIEIYTYHNIPNAVTEINVSRETFAGIRNGDIDANNYFNSTTNNGEKRIKTTATKIKITSSQSNGYNTLSVKMRKIISENEGYIQNYNKNITKINYCDINAINEAAKGSKIVELDCDYKNLDRMKRTVKAAKIVDTDVIYRFSPVFDEKTTEKNKIFWVPNVLGGKAKANDGEKDGYLIDITRVDGQNTLKKIITDILNQGIRGFVINKADIDLRQFNPFDKNLPTIGSYNDYVVETAVNMAKRYPKTVVYLDGFETQKSL